jgi:S1-C subfamily serine protease
MRNRLLTILTLFILSLSILSCATSNLDFQRDARDTFVKIKQNVAITVCNPADPKECLTKTSRSTGSGAVVMRTDEGSYVLTAGHVCSFEKEMQLASEFAGSKILVQMRSVNFSLGEYVSDIVSMDHTIDTCLLFARNLYTTKVAKIAPYSTDVEPGERVYNVAAPVGIFYKDVVPLLEGFFMGNRDTRAYYSIPAMGGSSGSPIFNSDNEIVGMIHSVNVYFPVVSVSPPLKELRAFIVNGIRKNERLRLGEKKDKVVEPFWKGLGLSDMSENSL